MLNFIKINLLNLIIYICASIYKRRSTITVTSSKKLFKIQDRHKRDETNGTADMNLFVDFEQLSTH